MKISILPIIFLSVFTGKLLKAQDTSGHACFRPFPQHIPYQVPLLEHPPISGQQVKAFFDTFKKNYLRHDTNGRMFILNDEGGDQKKNLTTSEANGYGMIILALMAGHDPDAHLEFDNMYAFALYHHSRRSQLLMRWRVKVDNTKNDDKESDTAIDGDLDMAYALLLAGKQWGKTQKYDYDTCAAQTLDEILKLEVDQPGLKLLRGNGGGDEIGSWQYNTIRLSDFMPDHFRAFAACTHKKIWLDLLHRYEKLYAAVQRELSSQYGLFPEYLIVSGDHFMLMPDSISEHKVHQEGVDDGGRDNVYGRRYGFNSCRVPWRLATDYLLNGRDDDWGKNVLQKISEGMRAYTNSDPCMLTDVFPLQEDANSRKNARQLKRDARHHSADLNVIGPVYFASLLESGQKDWRNMLLMQLLNDNPMPCEINNGIAKRDYYENALRMLFVLALSDNYWTPGS